MTELPVAVARKVLREFGVVTGGIVAVLFGLALPWLFGAAEFPRWPWIVGALLALWGLSWPAGLEPVYRGWMRFGRALGWVNTRILLGVLFFLLFLLKNFFRLLFLASLLLFRCIVLVFGLLVVVCRIFLFRFCLLFQKKNVLLFL